MGLASSCIPHINGDEFFDEEGESNIFDTYDIGELLGSGTFGQVRVCRQIGGASKRAVKIVDTQSEVFKQASGHISVHQEAEILEDLHHPHIVELVDTFDAGRWYFIVLECIVGGDLFAAIANPKVAVTERTVAGVMQQVFDALEYLHRSGIVHRDVKAENLLLTSNPQQTHQWHVKLIDFGLAMSQELRPPALVRFFSDALGQGGAEEVICGTAYYCAPEVWVGDYGPKLDVWAAAVVLYIALHGALPYWDRDPNMIETLIVDPNISPSFRPTPNTEQPDYMPSQIARNFLEAALTKEASQRPNAGMALADPFFYPPAGGGNAPQHLSTLNKSVSHLGIGHRSQQHQASRSQSLQEGDHLPAPGDPFQAIPFPVRRKAGRITTRAPIPASVEASRTAALDAMRQKRSTIE
mmetsp:Transcript_26424/g.48353  ORF Transcript_26424/g.48353 Transcript_26424/m.48353 type:complete len:411 (-) Transcript_26424:81-1313(-)